MGPRPISPLIRRRRHNRSALCRNCIRAFWLPATDVPLAGLEVEEKLMRFAAEFVAGPGSGDSSVRLPKAG